MGRKNEPVDTVGAYFYSCNLFCDYSDLYREQAQGQGFLQLWGWLFGVSYVWQMPSRVPSG